MCRQSKIVIVICYFLCPFTKNHYNDVAKRFLKLFKESTEFIHQRAGYDIRLHCGVQGLVDEEQLADRKIYWFFKVSATKTNHYII